MTGRMRISRTGLELIKSFEGFRDTALRLPDGRWTVGFGHVRSAREGVTISEKDAEDLLVFDLKPAEEAVRTQVLTPLNQNQYDALVSLAFNISPGQFRDSAILRALNAGDVLGAANGFDAWRKARINGRLMVVDALVRRRTAEKALFLEHPEGRPIAPTPLVTPELDQSGIGLVANDREFGPDVGLAKGGNPTLVTMANGAQAKSSPEPDVAAAISSMAANQQIRERDPGQAAPRAMPAAATRGETLVREAPQPSAVEEASRIAGERIARILARAEGEPRPANEPGKSNGRSSPDAPAQIRPAVQASLNPAPQAREIPDELPDFSMPAAARPKSKRIVIDDTEEYDPSLDLHPQTSRVSPRVNKASASPLDSARLVATAPWIATLVVSAPLLGIGVIDLMQGPAEHPWAPMMTSVFGLLVIASIYFIASRSRTRD